MRMGRSLPIFVSVAVSLLAIGCSEQQPTAPDLTSPQLQVTSLGPTGPLLKIYFTDGGVDRAGLGGPGTVRSVNPDGSGLTTLVASAGRRPRGITVDDINGHIYWNDFGGSLFDPPGPGTTRKSNLDGSGAAVLYTHLTPTGAPLSGINDIDIDIAAGELYISHSVSISPYHGVRRGKTDGSSIVDLIVTWPPGSESPAGTITSWWVDGLALDLVNGHIYRGDPGVFNNGAGTNGIVRSNLDGTGSTSLVPWMPGRGRGLALDLAAGKMYFGEHVPAGVGNGRIWVANLDGTGLVVVVPGLQRPRDLALDLFAGKIYWVDEHTRKIQRSNLDGSNVQDVVTGLDGPSSLSLVFQRFIEVAFDIKPGSCPNPFNIGKKGVMPAAILGTDEFDVADVDPATVKLQGVAPLRWAMEDVATPFGGELDDRYSCTEDGPDGFTDLTLKFDAPELAAALGVVADGDEVILTLTGNTMDGIPIEGQDIVFIIKKK